jgi:hypothetical protein
VVGFAVSGAQRETMIVIAFGFGDDQSGLRKARLDGGCNAGNQSAAGGRRHHDVGR